MTVVTHEEKLSVPCPRCGAIPGAQCTEPDGELGLNHPHPQRREAFLVMLKRAGDNVSAWRDSPAEGYPDVEPEDEV